MAGGTFSPGEVKVRPGNYHREVSDITANLAGNINGIGAGLIKANWGPLNEAVAFDGSTDVNAVFGSGQTESLITEMFNGGITSGFFVRIGTGGTAPKITLKDTASSPAAAVEITGKYVGTRAFTATVRTSLINTEEKELIILDGTSEYAKVSFEAGTNEPDALVKAINSTLTDFTAKKSGSGGNGTLAAVTQSPFTAGTNPTVSTAQYSTGLSVLEAYEWNCLCVDTEDVAVHALIPPYLNRIYAAGSYPLACIAEKAKGDGAVTLDERIAHAAAFNNRMVHYVLNPTYDSAGNLYDGWKNAARIGGYIAAINTNDTLTGKPVTGYTSLAEPLTNTQIINALKKGCIVLSRNRKGQIVIEQGINTLITPSGDEDEGWKKIRRVKVRYELIQRIMATLDELRVDNDEQGRAAVIAAAYGVYSEMVGENKLLAGGSVILDESKKPRGDSAWFKVLCDDKDSLEKTYSTFRFRFAPEE